MNRFSLSARQLRLITWQLPIHTRLCQRQSCMIMKPRDESILGPQATWQPLLALPRELRDDIIDYVLHDLARVHFPHTGPTSVDDFGNSLLLVCRQMRYETLERLTSLKLSSVLEDFRMNIIVHHAACTMPLVQCVHNLITQQVDIILHYPRPEWLQPLGILAPHSIDSDYVNTIISRVLVHPVRHVHIKVYIQDASRVSCKHYGSQLVPHEAESCRGVGRFCAIRFWRNILWALEDPGLYGPSRHMESSNYYSTLETVSLSILGTQVAKSTLLAPQS